MKAAIIATTAIFLAIDPGTSASLFTGLSSVDQNGSDRSQSLVHSRSLVQRINIIGRDDRRELPEIQKELGFSPAEVHQAMACTGYVLCPGAHDGKGSLASAGSIIDNGQIVTVRHLFEQNDGSAIPRMNECFFKNYLGQKTPLKDPQGTFSKGLSSKVSLRNDQMVIKLKDRLASCQPYPLHSVDDPMEPGQKLIALSFLQARMPQKYIGLAPTAQRCEAMKVYDAVDGRSSSYRSDCDNTEGGSGGLNLVRKGSSLIVTGIFTGGGGAEMDGQPYSDATESYTVSVGLDSDSILSELGQPKP